MTSEHESDLIKQIEALRRQVRNHYNAERFDEGDKAKVLLEKMEAFAINRGWRLPDW